MPAQTTFGVPYPQPTDPVSAGADDIRRVAEALDSRVLAGRIDWSPAGGAPADTSLYRAYIGQVGSNGVFAARHGAAGVTFLGNPNDSATPGIYFGPGLDASIVRWNPTVLRVFDELQSQKGMVVDAGGTGAGLYFGALGDTVLYRGGAGIVATTGAINAGGVISAKTSAAGQVLLAAIGANADIPAVLFGNAQDVAIYRNSANTLRSDNNVTFGGRLDVQGAITANAGQLVLQGSGLTIAGDTNLYRIAAQQLKTDGKFHVGATILRPDAAFPTSGDTAIEALAYNNYSGNYVGKVTVGGTDSGGPGYRVLRVPN